MAEKLKIKTFPAGTNASSFKCFGPIATEDGQFRGTKMADLGCFNQQGIDTNKAYHGAVVQDRASGKWYAYFEWGRTGNKVAASFQFYPATSERHAEEIYIGQMESKNIKRGVWATVAGRRVLQPKPGEDSCYVVRPLATRSADAFGLPDAASVVSQDVRVQTAAVKPSSSSAAKPVRQVDEPTMKLMRDMNVATIEYTKTNIVGGTIPTQGSIDRGRELIQAARSRLQALLSRGATIDDQVRDREMIELTSELYGRIPRIKRVGAPVTEWALTENNMLKWDNDLDAFESALRTSVCIEQVSCDADPLGGMPIDMEWVNPSSDEGAFLMKWLPAATRGRHSNMGDMQVYNLWKINRHGWAEKFLACVKRVAEQAKVTDRPERQPKKRFEVDEKILDLFKRANVGFMFHGTRSVNVTGIMREGLRLPRQLVGVSINGALFGPGLYWADDWAKSSQYCSLPRAVYVHGDGAVRGRRAFMFVADVCLGRAHMAPRGSGFTKAPAECPKCHDHNHRPVVQNGSSYCPQCRGPFVECHSVWGKGGVSQFSGGTLRNNEWIVYDTAQYNFRYLVEFAA